MDYSFAAMFKKIMRAEEQGRAAKTVEVFGWIMLVESTILVFAPHFVVSLLHMPVLSEQAANFFRLVGLLVGGLGILYIISGRLNALGFIFASMIDRPMVPPIMLALWFFDILPWQLALLFSVSDFGSFLWTYLSWRKDAAQLNAS